LSSARAFPLAVVVKSHTLRRNKIAQDGGMALGKLLELNTSLARLDLRANAIADDGAAAIAKALAKNKVLTSYVAFIFSSSVG